MCDEHRDVYGSSSMPIRVIYRFYPFLSTWLHPGSLIFCSETLIAGSDRMSYDSAFLCI